VGPPTTDVLALTSYDRDSSGGASLSGYVTLNTRTRSFAKQVSVALAGRPDRVLVSVPVDPATGVFHVTLKDAPASVTVRSVNGGAATTSLPTLARPLVSAETAAITSAPGGHPPAQEAQPATPDAATETDHIKLEQLRDKAAKFLPRDVGRRPAPQ
jgi:hypothetical protein